MKIECNIIVEKVKQKVNIKNNKSDNEKSFKELFDIYRKNEKEILKKDFSEYDFIRLFLSTLLKKGVIKFDSANLGYRLIDFYRNDEYHNLFVMPVVEQIEGDYLDMSSCLSVAYLEKLISEPVEGIYDRLIIISDTDKIINEYSHEYKNKMDKLVEDYLLQQEKMITLSEIVIDDINDITKDCRTCGNMSCRVEQNEKPVSGYFGYINHKKYDKEKVKQFIKTKRK